METILNKLAPCGLDCSRCVRRKEGVIARNAADLRKGLEGFERMAEMMSGMNPLFERYADFSALLSHFAAADCVGCRNGASCNAGCAAKTCHVEKNVDFCFQCDEYPCSRNGFAPPLYEKWKANNDFMKEHGIEAFFALSESKTRY